MVLHHWANLSKQHTVNGATQIMQVPLATGHRRSQDTANAEAQYGHTRFVRTLVQNAEATRGVWEHAPLEYQCNNSLANIQVMLMHFPCHIPDNPYLCNIHVIDR